MICKTIKVGTFKCYLSVVASITLNYKQLCPLLDDEGQDAQCVKYDLSEVKRWESMPNRREPVTVKMELQMLKKCDRKYTDSLDSVLHDWSAL